MAPWAAGTIQTKLVINQAGDAYEREADAVSQQMMRSAEPLLQPVDASGPEQIVTAPSGHELSGSTGQPLDGATRGFMESRFGHDFSRVRVHTDRQAADSARALNALAYTVGHNITFDATQYAPGTSQGRQLLAHELTHVVQQTTTPNSPGRRISAGPSLASGALQRAPANQTQAEQRQIQKWQELARDPGKAHQAWKNLNTAERIAVAERMRRLYGGPFAEQFLDAVKNGKPQGVKHHYPRGAEPKPSELIKKGYRLGWHEHIAADLELQWWVHPLGGYVTIDVGTWKPGAAETKKEPGTKAPPARKPTADKTDDKAPPMDEVQLDNLLLSLDELHQGNNELQDVLETQPYDKRKAELAQAKWAFARDQLRSFRDVDMVNVYPGFWEEVDAASDEYHALLKRIYELGYSDFDPDGS